MMEIPNEIIELLGEYLDATEAAKATNALNKLVYELISRAQSKQISSLEGNLKLWMGNRLATKSDLEALKLEIKDDLRDLKEILEKIEAMAAKNSPKG